MGSATGLADGLYHVTNDKFSASFEIKDGKVVACAPILQRNFSYWSKKAKKIERTR